ncbi:MULTISPECIES: JAB domain-containing protein [unclassified Niallia]|uniref:JAB domain-containing protein n=1 Tax=Bacillaceae TaxID=186817 RepID=UPI0020419138|nr:DNA repair protein RadC [Niallia sp. MER 6]MCM3032883.1 DNA repair protein RadC [Niallia sp. MER 6]
MEKIYEVVRIKQITIENDRGLNLYSIKSPQDGAKIATMFIGDEDREVLFVICLNQKNRVNAVHRCHIGSLDASIIHPREVMKTAILNNSASIIIAHNHPSGMVEPSREDIEVTKRMVQAGDILGIPLLDHLIVNDEGKYYSLKEHGYI